MYEIPILINVYWYSFLSWIFTVSISIII